MSINENRNLIVELIENVRDGDQDAFEQLLEIYEPLLRSSVQRFTRDELMSHFEEDLRQEAMLVFYNAILNYDLGSDGVEFGLYAKICVTNALISQTRALSKRGAEELSDAIGEEDAAVQDEPSAKLIEQESLQKIDLLIRQNLSSFEYRVWCLFALGKTAKQIGEAVGADERSVSNAIYRIRKKLRVALG